MIKWNYHLRGEGGGGEAQIIVKNKMGKQQQQELGMGAVMQEALNLGHVTPSRDQSHP